MLRRCERFGGGGGATDWIGLDGVVKAAGHKSASNNTLRKWLLRVHSLPPSSSLANSSSACITCVLVGPPRSGQLIERGGVNQRKPTWSPARPKEARSYHAVQPEGAVVGGDDPCEEQGREALALQDVAHDLAGVAEQPAEGGVAWWFGGGGLVVGLVT